MKQPFRESDIQNLKGTRIVITGGNSGLGYQTAMMLAKKDAEVIIASKDQEKAQDSCKDDGVSCEDECTSSPLDQICSGKYDREAKS